MRSDHVQLAIEISLLSLFFVAVLVAVPAVVLTFTLVGELTTVEELAPGSMNRFEPNVYLLVFAELAIPIVILLGVGWALRRYVARPVVDGAAPEPEPGPAFSGNEDPATGYGPRRLQ